MSSNMYKRLKREPDNYSKNLTTVGSFIFGADYDRIMADMQAEVEKQIAMAANRFRDEVIAAIDEELNGKKGKKK